MNKNSDFKASFMLDQSITNEFVEYMEKFGIYLDKTSKYQIARVQIENSQILIYRSGVVIFEDNPIIQKIIREFLEARGITNQDFEKYEAVELEEEENRGWDETPKGVYLTETQIDVLIEKLQQTLTLQEGEKHERGRFVRDKQTLVINSNGVVYTIGGFDGIIGELREVIESNNPYDKFDRIVIIDELGRWEKLGPICFVLADLMYQDLIELQLAGVKDNSKSRNIDYLEFIPIIEEHSAFQSKLLQPIDINREIEHREEYIKFLGNIANDFINNQIINLNENTLLIIDENLTQYLDHSHKLVVKRKERDTPAIGVTSTICYSLIEKWKEDQYKRFGVHINKNNISLIRKHDKTTELSKSILM